MPSTGSNMRVLSRASFPEELREIPQPPKHLWVRGSLPPAQHRVLSVVGSRALTTYGHDTINLLVSGLTGLPLSIVSGLALGADAAAHRAALAAGLHTVAVPGSGLDESVLYPRTNRGLARDIIAAGGGLVSEHEPLHQARPQDFPARNRLMVGLSHAVLVIEAGEESGTLISARLAAEYNRELLCVPHRIGDPHAAASRIFLRLGATPIYEPVHLLEALGIPAVLGVTGTTLPNLSELEAHVYALLETPQKLTDLLQAMPLQTHELLAILAALELKGLVCERFGAWRRVCNEQAPDLTI